MNFPGSPIMVVSNHAITGNTSIKIPIVTYVQTYRVRFGLGRINFNENLGEIHETRARQTNAPIAQNP
jgi:hypothetical protein